MTVAKNVNGFYEVSVVEPSGEGTAHTGDGTRKIYLADASATPAGNDSNAGTQAAPKLTLAAGVAALRGATHPDHLYLKRGCTWTNQGFGAAPTGLSATDPCWISSYGTGARPILKINATTGNVLAVWFADYYPNLVVSGLDFYNYDHDPSNVGYDPDVDGTLAVSIVGSNLLIIEDNIFRFFKFHAIINGDAGVHQDVRLRRNIFVDSYTNNNPSDVDSSGILMGGWVNLLIEENLFDHNGWNEQLITPASVTITQASPAVVTWADNKLPQADGAWNWISFASTGGGITAATPYYVRSNNGTTFNLSATAGGALLNTTSGLVSPQNATYSQAGATVRNHNTYLGGFPDPGIILQKNIFARDSSGGQGRTGGLHDRNLEIGNCYGTVFGMPNDEAGIVSNCVYTEMVNRTVVGGAAGPLMVGSPFLGHDYDVGTVSFESCIICHANPPSAGDFGFQPQFTGNAVRNCVVWNFTGLGVRDDGIDTILEGNVDHSSNTNDGPGTDDIGNPFPLYTNPQGTIADYADEIGLTATTAAFLQACRDREPGVWDTDLAAETVTAWFRTNFDLAAYTGEAEPVVSKGGRPLRAMRFK